MMPHHDITGIFNRLAVPYNYQFHYLRIALILNMLSIAYPGLRSTLPTSYSLLPAIIMLMQPQSPNPDFDFMLKDQAQAKRGLALPGGKLVKIVAIAVVAVLLLVIITSILRGNKGGPQAMVLLLARENEILRVTQLAQNQYQLQDPGTTALAATVTANLTSQQQQFTTYLANNKVKPGKLQLAADTDKTMDSQLQAASQNNTLDATYTSYIKTGLLHYQQELQAAFDKAGPNGKALIQEAFDSTKTLLDNPPLKS